MNRETLLRLMGCALPLLAGCVVPYIFPHVAVTPRLELESAAREVSAFRVEIDRHVSEAGAAKPPEREVLTRVAVENRDEIPPQVQPSVTYGVVVNLAPVNYHSETSKSLLLRLYRPGYELVEVTSWDISNHVAWKPAGTLEEQEHTLDRLFPADRVTGGGDNSAHADALLFGAMEYKKLALEAKGEADETRLNRKSEMLRMIAAAR